MDTGMDWEPVELLKKLRSTGVMIRFGDDSSKSILDTL